MKKTLLSITILFLLFSTANVWCQIENDGLLYAQGLVSAASGNSISVRSLEGKMVTGNVTSDVLIYDLSKPAGDYNSTGLLSNIKKGDVACISYITEGNAASVVAIMFLPEGKQIHSTWQQMYQQLKPNK